MFKHTKAFSGYSVDDMAAAQRFYGETLGLDVEVLEESMGLLSLHIEGGTTILLYTKPDHVPATFTVLNFPVDDVEAAVDQLASKGVAFLRYDDFGQDDKAIARGGGGPAIAWFTDPAGNVLSVLEAQ